MDATTTVNAVAAAPVAVSHMASFLAGLNSFLDSATALLDKPFLPSALSWGLALLGGGGCVKWLKNRSVQKYAHLAFMAVEEADRRDPNNQNLNKAALFAEHFEAFMRRAGWWMLTDDDVKQAQAIADALNLAYENAKAYKGDPPVVPTPDAASAAVTAPQPVAKEN